jgi:CBS domain containing-hemolysin-like protein
VTGLALIASGVLVAITAVLRAGGASLVRTPRADALHDAADGNGRAAIVADLLEERTRIQPALSPVLTSLLVLAVIPATWAFVRMFDGWVLFLVLVAMAFLLIVIVDVVPRTVGRSRPRTLAYRYARLLSWAIAVGDATNDLVADEEGEPDEDDSDRTEAEELELISSVLDFTDTLVREVMVPRPDMVTITGDASTAEALDLVLEAGRSRIPVTGESVDDIAGVLYARDLLLMLDQAAPDRPCVDTARDPYFVPETKRVSEMLREMQENQVHMAIVVDEFGGTAGLVTIEDLLEELVGEIADEYDREEPMVTPIGAGEYLIDARLDVDSLADLLDTELPSEEWDTVGGLVLGLAGRVPREGESFEYDGLELTADRVQGRRVSKVRVAKR